MELTLLAVLVGFVLDCILGDPAGLPHPICLIGKLISLCEKALRRLLPQTDRGALTAGGVMVLVVVLLTGAVPLAVLWLCLRVNRWLYFAVCCIMCWQLLAAKCLYQEAEKVHACLTDLPAARRQVGMLVGRDTDQLTQTQIIKATVETVAENTSDGVIAPLFWMMLGGPVAGFIYKAINTMDSMVGYKNERYLYFGRAAAKLDDVVNYIPARLAGLGMIAAAGLCGFDGKNALRIWKRDRHKHASPNSAQTEAACAGALHIQLAGDAYYFGKLYKKPFLGDADRPIEPSDISRSCKLMYASSLVLLLAFQAMGWLLAFLI